MTDIVAKRTINTKTWKLGRNRFKKRFSSGPLHYVANGKFHDIDLTARLVRDQYLIDKASFALRIDRKTPAYRFINSNGSEVSVELMLSNNLDISEYKDNRSFIWKDVSVDTDYLIIPTKKGVSTSLVLHSDRASRRWSWEVLGDKTLIRPIVGYDADGKLLQLAPSWSGDLLTVEWSGLATNQKRLRELRGAEVWTGDIKYPVIIDPTVNEVITAGADDVMTFFSSQLSNFSLLAVGYNASIQTEYVGVRFQTIAIPQGATVSSATLTIDVISVNGSPINIRVYGSDVDDAGAWSGGNLAKNITKTTAYAGFTATATGTMGIGVTGVVQEIISRTGWSSSNNMAFGFFAQTLSGGNNISFAALEHSTRQEAHLDITYSTGAGGSEPDVAAIML